MKEKILNETQEKVLETFSKSELGKKFYWTGGTALAFLYLKHRRSDDLDFFTEDNFSLKDLDKFIKELKEKLNLKQLQINKLNGRYEIIIKNKKICRIDFNKFEYKRLKRGKKWKNIIIDSLDDIAANKTLSLIDRNEPKDVFDIYFLIKKKKFTPQKLLKLVEKKFGLKFSINIFFEESLKKVKYLNRLGPYFLLKNKNILKEIRKFFELKSAGYLRKFLK